jgi:hypothetical protein
MKYITSVRNKDQKRTEHIIDCGSGNVTVLEIDENLGNGMPGSYFSANGGIIVSKYLSVNTNHQSLHLAQIVLAVEQVRFVIESAITK